MLAACELFDHGKESARRTCITGVWGPQTVGWLNLRLASSLGVKAVLDSKKWDMILFAISWKKMHYESSLVTAWLRAYEKLFPSNFKSQPQKCKSVEVVKMFAKCCFWYLCAKSSVHISLCFAKITTQVWSQDVLPATLDLLNKG